MDYAKLKQEIKAIADIANDVPEPFREKCFQLLLENLLGSQPGGESKPGFNKLEEEKTLPPAIPISAQVRVLMSKTGVTKDDLGRILFVEDGEAHFTREPSHGKVARGQIEWALLLALQNGILNNSLTVDPEDVRSICQVKGFYDAGNFTTNFKTPKNAKLFRNPLESQGEPQPLTAEGQTTLGKLIKSLAEASE